MALTPEFVEKVKTILPDWEKLHEALDNDSEWVGRYLDEVSHNARGMNPGYIVKMIDEGKIVQLRKEAMEKETRRTLYGEWLELNPPPNMVDGRS